MWLHSAERFVNRDDVKQLIVVIAPEDREEFQAKFAANTAILGIEVVEGGEHRTDSVAKALARVRPDIDFVAVHDAARPCLANEWIDKVFAAAEKTGAAMLAIPVRGTLKRVQGGVVAETVDRQDLWEAQTPQVFRRQLLLDAYAQRGDLAATDDAHAGRTAGPRRDDRRRLADQLEGDHKRGLAARSASPESPAQAQVTRPRTPVCRRRQVAVSEPHGRNTLRSAVRRVNSVHESCHDRLHEAACPKSHGFYFRRCVRG